MNELQKKLEALQRKLRIKLIEDREEFDHPTAKGDMGEDSWLVFLRKHLPRRYRVDRAFVMDAKGRKSDQLDLVIYDWQYTPHLYEPGSDYRHRWIPAESVYAVFEVKQTLQKDYFREAGQKVASVRRLERTSAPVVHAGGTFRDPKPPLRILGGILCLESQWKLPFDGPLKNAISDLRVSEEIDLGCCIEGGGFEIGWGSGPPEALIVPPEQALPFFLMRLLARLQALGTVPAIDYGRYGELLGLPRVS